MSELENPWTPIFSEEKYVNAWIRVREDKVLNPSGNEGIYGVVEFRNIATGIVPVDSEGFTWLVGQWRYPLEEYTWEIPEGGGELGEPPVKAAKRELREEVGLEARSWSLLQRAHLSNSVSNEVAYIYLATGIEVVGEPEHEETEKIDVHRVPLEHAVQMVLDGEITDSVSVMGLLRAAIVLGRMPKPTA